MEFSESLKKNQDFQKVYRNGKSCADRNLVMYLLPNGTERNRLGISCSKKVGNSIVRHRFARLVRESYRLHESLSNRGFDIVVIARPCAKELGFHEIERSFLYLAGKVHLMQNSEPHA